MKEVQKERVQTYTVFEAWDGEIFTYKKECEEYERSAGAVLMTKLEDSVIATDFDTDVFDCSEENKFKTIVPRNKETIDVINQLWFMYGGKGKEVARFTSEDINKPIMVGYRLDDTHYDWVWFYKLKDIVKDLTDGKYKLVESEETENK